MRRASAAGEGLVQRRHAVRVQIVQNHPHHRGIGVSLIHQPAHPVGEVLPGAPFRDRHVSPARQGLAGQEDVARTGAAILVILTPRLSRLHRDGRPGVGQQLGGSLVKADHRPVRDAVAGRRAQHTSPARPPSPPPIHPLPWGCATAASATAGGRFFEPQPHRLVR